MFGLGGFRAILLLLVLWVGVWYLVWSFFFWSRFRAWNLWPFSAPLWVWLPTLLSGYWSILLVPFVIWLCEERGYVAEYQSRPPQSARQELRAFGQKLGSLLARARRAGLNSERTEER